MKRRVRIIVTALIALAAPAVGARAAGAPQAPWPIQDASGTGALPNPGPAETLVELPATSRPAAPQKSECGEAVIGEVKPAPASITEAARWSVTATGRSSRIVLRSPGAQGLRFALDREKLPRDLEVDVYSPVGAERHGPYRPAAEGLRGEWWSPIIAGDALGIEFRSASASEGAPVPDIPKLAYLYDLGPLSAAELPCHNDIGCRPEWADASYAVARMAFNCAGSLCTVCTGTLINRPANDHPWLFLTARHCIGTDAAAASLSLIFFFQNQSCGSNPMMPVQIIGSELLAQRADDDVTLLGLSQAPPAGVTYLDYDITNPFPYGSFVGCIHHPAGTTKRYTAGGLVDSGIHDIIGIPNPVSTWDVEFDDGAVEKGSSGSPLLDSSRRIHGVLSGGDNACGDPESALYGRFDLAYSTLQTFLGDVPNPVWCHPAASGDQYGTVLFPFATIRRATQFCIAPGGTLRLWTGTYHENPTFTKPMIVETYGGGVTIGTP